MTDLSTARSIAASLRVPTGDGLSARGVADLIDELADALHVARKIRLAEGVVQHLIDRRVHSPARMRAYLLAKGFECIRQYPDSSTWHHPGCVEHTPTCRSRLLDDDRFSDYAKVTGMLVQDVAAFLCVGELRVLAEIEATEVKEGSDA